MTKNETVYSVKYALTAGIKQVTGERSDSGRFMSRNNGLYQSLTPKEWADNPEDAVEKARELLKKKLASLRKQITKLEALEFSVETIKTR